MRHRGRTATYVFRKGWLADASEAVATTGEDGTMLRFRLDAEILGENVRFQVERIADAIAPVRASLPGFDLHVLETRST